MKVTVVRLAHSGFTSLCYWDIESIHDLKTKNDELEDGTILVAFFGHHDNVFPDAKIIEQMGIGPKRD